MAAVFVFLGIWATSLVVAVVGALQLGDYFRANDEFPLVIVTLVVVVSTATAVFVIACAWSRNVHILHRTGLVLALLAFWPVVAPGFVQTIADHSTNPSMVGIENTYIRVELVVPTLLAVLVQWGLVRRRWLRAAGDDDFTRWPWVTTVIAALVVLNPFGLNVLGAALAHSPSNYLWALWAEVAAVAALALVVMAVVECYIRGRIARRRLVASPPPDGGQIEVRA
jgi:hypothetical protein